MNESTEEATMGGLAEEIDGNAMGPAVLASVGSIGLALYYYYVRDEKQRGQFIGLWPATILGLAVYFKLNEIEGLLQQARD